jgi:hypothetical protein
MMMDTNYTHPPRELREPISTRPGGYPIDDALVRVRRHGPLGPRLVVRPAPPSRVIEIGTDGDPLIALRVRRGDVAVRAEVDGDLDDALLVVASTADAECSLDGGVVEIDVFDPEYDCRLSYRVNVRPGESTSSVLRRWFWGEVSASDGDRRAAVRSAMLLLADLLIDQALAEESSP